MAQSVKCLPDKYKELSSDFRTHKKKSQKAAQALDQGRDWRVPEVCWPDQ